ncbi:LptF/LptG family permease [Entomospira culicis]|uniref:LptF/LptG family permease n=1 Tax=Entomospira culicis TaxID=2719989 RepID=A0A968GHN7_9SPIO|nr:LptF/LptG family permease [Entomospira culicis]NIZ18949.1 LptF/LptG family permease [Entomospira culicis]NIZ69164.1 LptF/LptG family permease [Entomospira culicis]WDI37751.1 LptF/LptG family permease [Entomospira culicis]WDI39379.1 LptF/LptG family permease [Entomospira culicis]
MAKLWRAKQLYRYLLVDIAKTHLFLTLLFIFFVLLSNIWYFAPEWLELGVSIRHVLVMVLFFIPGAMIQATPIALSLAFLVSYTRLQLHKEIDAMRSLGFGIFAIFRPLLHYTLFTFFLTFGVAFGLYPYSMSTFEQYYSQVLSRYIKIDTKSNEPKMLGDMILYGAIFEGKEQWLVVDMRDGYRLVLWATNADVSMDGGLRALSAEEVDLLVVERNSNGQSWSTIVAKDFRYPLIFSIKTQSYNPYDGLILRDLWARGLALRDEHYRRTAFQRERLVEINALLRNGLLTETDRDLYLQERVAIKKDFRFNSDFVSYLFVVLLRTSHLLFVITLVFLAFLLVERLGKRSLWILLGWVVALIFYWISFYLISFQILRLRWSPITLLLPVMTINLVNLLLFWSIQHKKRGLGNG